MFKKIKQTVKAFKNKPLTGGKDLLEFHSWMKQKIVDLDILLDVVAKERKEDTVQLIRRAKLRKKEIKND